MIKAKIAVNKIDKEHLFKGSKHTYLDITLVPTPDSPYGDDFMVVQDVSKEKREEGVKGPILGNANKIQSRRQAESQQDTTNNKPPENDDVPF